MVFRTDKENEFIEAYSAGPYDLFGLQISPGKGEIAVDLFYRGHANGRGH